MTITITELKTNLREGIYITKTGKIIAKLSNHNQKRVEIVSAIQANVTQETCQKELDIIQNS